MLVPRVPAAVVLVAAAALAPLAALALVAAILAALVVYETIRYATARRELRGHDVADLWCWTARAMAFPCRLR